MPRNGSTRNLGQESPFPDISAADTDVFGETDEYDSNRYHASTSSTPSPLLSTPVSTISSQSFAVRGPGDLSSPSSAVSSRPESLLFTADPFSPPTSTSRAGSPMSPFLSNLQGRVTLESKPFIFTHSPARRIVDDLPLLSRHGAPRLISQLILTSPAHNDELNNEQDDHDTTYQSLSSSGDGSHCTAPECFSPRQEYQPERVPEIHVPSFGLISDNYKPSILVVDWEISLSKTHSVLSALRHSLQRLTIGPAPIINQCLRPSTTEKIDLSQLTSLTVDRGVDYAALNELLHFARMDNLRSLQLHVDESQGVMPHELNIQWHRLTDVTLHGNLSPGALNRLMGTFPNVTRLEWSGDLVGASHKEYSYDLHPLQTVSVCSNEDGCTFFLQSLRSQNLWKIHLSHFSPLINGSTEHGLTTVRELSISSTKIDVDQLLATLSHFPSLTTADFVIGDIKATDTDGRSPKSELAQLTSLTLRSISSPIQPLLESIPLSNLDTLKITFNVAAGDQPFSGLADWLQKEKIPLTALHLVGTNMAQEELRSCLATVCSTLVDYYIELACFS